MILERNHISDWCCPSQHSSSTTSDTPGDFKIIILMQFLTAFGLIILGATASLHPFFLRLGVLEAKMIGFFQSHFNIEKYFERENSGQWISNSVRKYNEEVKSAERSKENSVAS